MRVFPSKLRSSLRRSGAGSSDKKSDHGTGDTAQNHRIQATREYSDTNATSNNGQSETRTAKVRLPALNNEASNDCTPTEMAKIEDMDEKGSSTATGKALGP